MHTSFREKHPYLFYSAMSAGIALLMIPLLIFSVWAGLFGSVPNTADLQKIRNHEASQVMSADSVILGSYYLQNRTAVGLGEVSPLFIDALLSIEDIRFYEHDGLDRRALLRVFVKSVLLQQNAGGGSTITQQLAKNLFPRKWRSGPGLVIEKIKEMITARRLEKTYSKPEILELYINTVSFGEDIYGLERASHRYFSIPPDELELHQAAALAGLLKATSYYNPNRNPEHALYRRNIVLRQMEKYGMISSMEADSAINLPISTDYSRVDMSDGPAPYFREHLRVRLNRILDTLKTESGRPYNLFTDGLVIETTIDSRVQSAADRAISGHMKQLQSTFNEQQKDSAVFRQEGDPAILSAWKQSNHYHRLKDQGLSDGEIEKRLYEPVSMEMFTWDGIEEMTLSPYDSLRHYLSFLNTGFMAMDASQGEVRAWVGGINHQYFQFDHVTSTRQPGSAFKPIVYAAALESGLEPCSYRRNQLYRYSGYEEWTPRNAGEEYGGRYSLQGALVHSVNTVTIDMLFDLGVSKVRTTASGMGITSWIPDEPSIALGTANVSLLELTSAYSTFLNSGAPVQPYYLKAIYDSEGELIHEFVNPNTADSDSTMTVISPETSGALLQMLSKAVDDGTGYPLRNQFGIQHALAGKTGTSQHNSDGWFAGMTPELVFTAWVGGDNPRVRLHDNSGYASQTALPVAGYFLNNLANDPGLNPQPDQFRPDQLATTHDLSCPDYREDSFLDRAKNFLTGQRADEPQHVDESDEKKSLIDRIRNLFRKDP